MAGLVNVDIGSALTGIGSLARSLRAAITGKEPIDSVKAAELALKAEEMEAGLLNAQAAINQVEAASSNMFIAGWRPFIGWVCASGVAMEFVVKPLVLWSAALAHYAVVLPAFDTAAMIGMVTSMLGLAAYRTVEKTQRMK